MMYFTLVAITAIKTTTNRKAEIAIFIHFFIPHSTANPPLPFYHSLP